MHAPTVYLTQTIWSKVFLWMLDEKWENLDATYKNLSTVNFFASQILLRNRKTQAVPEVLFLFLELACKARSRATQNMALPHASTNKIAAYAILLGPGEVAMLHKYLSTDVTHFVYVLYLIFHSYLSLQFYATLNAEIDSSSSDLVEKWFIKSIRSQNEIRLFIANTTHCANHFNSIDRCFLTDPRFLPKYMICARISSFQAMGISVKEWVPFKAMITVSVTYLVNFAEEPPHLSSEWWRDHHSTNILWKPPSSNWGSSGAEHDTL